MSVRILHGDVRADGLIRPGQRLSPATEFKSGQHWRAPKPYYDREWLVREYGSGRTTQSIADVVLDPFFGSGTVGLVCDRLHRECIGIDLDERNVPMATDRIRGESPLFAEVV